MQAIVCVSENWGIGLGDELLFHLPSDMKRFRALTLGKTIVVGSRTLKSFPDGKPLSERRNIVLTRSEVPIEGAELAHTREDVLALAGADAIVVGGASVYTLLLRDCDMVRVTKVYASPPADSYFPRLDSLPDWRTASESELMEENGLSFRYIDYVRK